MDGQCFVDIVILNGLEHLYKNNILLSLFHQFIKRDQDHLKKVI